MESNIQFIISIVWGIIKVIGSLGIFLFGSKVMSESIHKLVGDRFQYLLNWKKFNRYTGVITGITIAFFIQSSNAVTIILSSFVNAGFMNLTQAISVIMGANIGATLLVWMVSIFGFKFDLTIFILPVIAIGFPFIFNKKEILQNIGKIFIGFGLLFLGIYFLKTIIPQADTNYIILKNFIYLLSSFGFFSIVFSVIIGAIVTLITQSSFAAIAVTITLGFNGWINFDIAAALCLGQNLGKIITLFFETSKMKIRKPGFANILIIIIGVVWALCLFYPLLQIVDFIIPGNMDNPQFMPFHISAFNTLFNVVNTLILIWFIPNLIKIIEFLIHQKEDKIQDYKLNYIKTVYPDFAETNLVLAKKEIGSISLMVYDMLLLFLNSIKQDKKEIKNVEEIIIKQDKKIDKMYVEINRFLAECRKNILIEKQSVSINSMLIIIGELKNISDSCENLILLLKKKEKKKLKFHKNAKTEIEEYTEEVLDFLKYNCDYINQNLAIHNFDLAEKMEKVINTKRDRLRKISQNKMTTGASIQGELIYMDIVKHLEHIGDFNMNIAHSLKEM